MTNWEIRQGDALEQLALMDAGTVQTCITSPPYFGLRDYGTGEWDGGDQHCDHLSIVCPIHNQRMVLTPEGDGWLCPVCNG